MFGWLKSTLGLGRSAPAVSAPGVRGRYDSALTTNENRELWGQVDFLSARSANDFSTRRILRMRSRYECANNSYARGITINVANDIIGTGPTLRVLGEDGASRQIEAAWGSWAAAVGLAEKLRIKALAKVVDGEGFAVLITNPRVRHSVQLYPKVIEADQVMTPAPTFDSKQWVDGCVLDPVTGEVIAYNVLRQHPGDLYSVNLSPLAYDAIPVRHVLHWFRRDRPGQARGIPEMTPSLELFSQLRRYTKAVIGAAEVAAEYAAMLETDAPLAAPDDDETGNSPPFSTLRIIRNMLTVSPAGWKMKQFKPEQPVTSYDMFVDKIIAEACRCLDIPVNMALGTSQKFNFSSARLDHYRWHRKVKIERSHCQAMVLEPLFAAWFDEAIMVPGLLPEGKTYENLPHVWHWPAFDYLDPQVDAAADSERLANGTTTLAEIYAEQGKDWEEELEQRGKEIARMKELGIGQAPPQNAGGGSQKPADAGEGEGEGEGEDVQAPAPGKKKRTKDAEDVAQAAGK